SLRSVASPAPCSRGRALSALARPHCTPSFPSTHTAPPELYTLSLHDALPISGDRYRSILTLGYGHTVELPGIGITLNTDGTWTRSEEHTSELQSRFDLVCRLLLEKKKKIKQKNTLTEQKEHTTQRRHTRVSQY